MSMPMQSFGEPHRAPLRKSEKVWPPGGFFFDDEKFFLKDITDRFGLVPWGS